MSVTVCRLLIRIYLPRVVIGKNFIICLHIYHIITYKLLAVSPVA